MYDFLIGKLVEKNPTAIAIDVNGIGFEVSVPLSTSYRLPAIGEKVKLLTHFVVREDAHLLFGFATAQERSVFRLLIGVSGVGPKMALTILSRIGVAELKQAIAQGSLPMLTAISGIGRKTAERLIIELREKIVVEDHYGAHAGVFAGSGDEALVSDSIQALISLGYNKQDAKSAIQKVLGKERKEPWDAELLVRESLKHI